MSMTSSGVNLFYGMDGWVNRCKYKIIDVINREGQLDLLEQVDYMLVDNIHKQMVNDMRFMSLRGARFIIRDQLNWPI